jgi:Dolichyl-phosphate-mannose-protein mannosyltransferase
MYSKNSKAVFSLKFLADNSIGLYVGALLFSNLIFFNHILDWKWWLFGLVEVISFFYFSNELNRTWAKFKEKRFLKKLFVMALIIRLSWMIFSYFFYISMTGSPFEFESADAKGYHGEAIMVSTLLHEGDFHTYFDIKAHQRGGAQISDMGYPVYLGFQYYLTDDSILIARIIKSLLSAVSCLLLYKLAKRNFGENVGRQTAIFCMMMPNLILYTGTHMKEVEMVFLIIWFMERADFMLRNKNFNFIEIAPPIALIICMFFFRTVLGITAVFALFTAVILTPNKIIKAGKKTIIFIWLIGVVAFFIGGSISSQIEDLMAQSSTNQENSMNWRAGMVNGNKFAKYMTGAVFAPMIFVIPFPTVVGTSGQENQQLINGGNYVKNILAFFLLIAVVYVFKEHKWREYLLIGTFVVAYLAILAKSAFAQSERFHQPVVPFEIMMACYGLSVITKKQKKYFNWWIVLIFIAIVGWSWFKLAGRNMT